MTIGRPMPGLPIPVSRAIRAVILSTSQRIILGSHSAISGNQMTNSMAIKSQPRKGKAARQHCPIVVPEGPRSFIIYRLIPKGGVVAAISTLRRNTTPNHTGENPKAKTIGINMGRLIIIIALGGINIPRNSKITCIDTMTKSGVICSPVAILTNSVTAPEKAKT